MTRDFWPACGAALLKSDERGALQPTPAYFAAWLQRPELALVAESCAAEQRLHRRLLQDPYRPVSSADLARLGDADVRDNYRHYLQLRQGLLQAGSLQAWLLQLWRQGNRNTPPLFVASVVQAVVHGLLQDEDDAVLARAGELLFREQRLTQVEGRMLAGDRETLDLQSETHGFGDIGRLLAQAQQPLKAVQMQTLTKKTAADYWAEARKPHGLYRFVLDLTHHIEQPLGHGLNLQLTLAHSGLNALAQVLQRWVAQMLGVQTTITPLQRIDDPQWRWHIGLDTESSFLLNSLYTGQPVDPERQQRLISLFRLDFAHAQDMRADVAGRPVYLGLAMTADRTLRLKPQNLLLNLPLAHCN